MKTIEKVAILLVILFVVRLLFGYGIGVGLARLLGPAEYGVYKFQLHLASSLQLILSAIVSICVAVWLYRDSKTAGMNPWVWAVFSLAYGLSAAILYFLIRVLQEIRCLKQMEGRR